MQIDVVLILLRRWFSHAFALACLLAGCSGSAQSSLPSAPRSQLQSSPAPASHLYPYAGLFLGYGSSVSSAETRATGGFGAGLGFGPEHLPLFAEVGVMGPQANRSASSAYVSMDASVPLARSHARVLPVALVGYSRLFQAGNAVDYGVALVLPRPWKPTADMRLELRDYWTFTDPAQHNVMLRIGLITFVPD